MKWATLEAANSRSCEAVAGIPVAKLGHCQGGTLTMRARHQLVVQHGEDGAHLVRVRVRVRVRWLGVAGCTAR